MKLSKNFTLEELCVTNVDAENEPALDHVESLTKLVVDLLQPLRDLYGNPIKVNSGFRSHAVNKKVGGSPSSQHLKGEAADISGYDNAILFKLIHDKFIFDQLIWEEGNENQPAWIHVSYKSQGNREEVLKMINGKYLKMY